MGAGSFKLWTKSSPSYFSELRTTRPKINPLTCIFAPSADPIVIKSSICLISFVIAAHFGDYLGTNNRDLFLKLGITYLDMDLLLGYSENENLSGWRFAETAVRDIAKIQSKSMDKPIKQTLSNSLQSPAGGRCITPMTLALSQASEMKALTGVDIEIIEQEMDYKAGSLALIKRLFSYWSRLGSSKSRTQEQPELGKEMVMDMMMEAPEDTTFAFTDGSCQPNPGPCGAGAVLYQPHLDPVSLKKPVCKRGSILLGELVAVQIALEYFLQHLETISCRFLKIFSDSQSTVGILTLNWKETGYKDITTEIYLSISTASPPL